MRVGMKAYDEGFARKLGGLLFSVQLLCVLLRFT
jgi:hypothetical protein